MEAKWCQKLKNIKKYTLKICSYLCTHFNRNSCLFWLKISHCVVAVTNIINKFNKVYSRVEICNGGHSLSRFVHLTLEVNIWYHAERWHIDTIINMVSDFHAMTYFRCLIVVQNDIIMLRNTKLIQFLSLLWIIFFLCGSHEMKNKLCNNVIDDYCRPSYCKLFED